MTSSEEGALFDRAVIMLIITVVTINLCNLMKMNGVHIVGETTIYVLVGAIISFIVIQLMHSHINIKLSSTFFSFVLLPPIIFEGGFTLQRVTFMRNLVPILLLALVGAVYSTLVTSLLMHLFTRIIKPQFTLLENLVFGAIISSTDPISVLGMLPPSTDRNLYMMIFGESALNDAVAVILYRLFEQLVEMEKTTITGGQLAHAIADSLWIFVKSAGIGIIVALMFAKLTKHVRPPEAPVFELLMFLVFPYSSYLLCEVAEGTGIIGIFFAGITMAHYAYDNLSKITILSAKIVLRTISSLSDAFIFIYLGTGILAFHPNTHYDFSLIAAAIFSILVSRSHVFIIGRVYNWFNQSIIRKENKSIPWKHLVFLWFCGLRGAVAFALSVKILDIEAFNHDGVQSTLFGTVVAVVIFTVVVFGALTKPMMKWLKLDQESIITETAEDEKSVNVDNHDNGSSINKSAQIKRQGTHESGQKAKRHSLNTIDEYVQQSPDDVELEAAQFMDVVADGGFWMKLYEWDRRYIIPFFRVEAKRVNSHNVLNDSSESFSLRKGAHVLGSETSLDDIVYNATNNTTANINQQHTLDRVSQERLDQLGPEDELDKVPISVAAEMFGIPGSAIYNLSSANTPISVTIPGAPISSTQEQSSPKQSPVTRSSKASLSNVNGTQERRMSRLGSMTVIATETRDSAQQTAFDGIEMQVVNGNSNNLRSPPTVHPTNNISDGDDDLSLFGGSDSEKLINTNRKQKGRKAFVTFRSSSSSFWNESEIV